MPRKPDDFSGLIAVTVTGEDVYAHGWHTR